MIKTGENRILNGTKTDIVHTYHTTMVTELLPSPTNMESKTKIVSSVDSTLTDGVTIDNVLIAGNLKNIQCDSIENDNGNNIMLMKKNGVDVGNFKETTKNGFATKTKRKRRRGKPKQKSQQTKSFRKSNWRFQMPRYRNGDDSSGTGGCANGNGNGNGGGGGGGNSTGGRRVMRTKLTRSRSIAPYNTNKFLMEEHMAELPSAHLTPSGRTRDSSFSVDSEDNYFYSLPEDEEEFLTKEFANVYERARVERLEGMTKQQLIEECLQLEDRYGQETGMQQNGAAAADLMNKIRALEERVRDLVAENLDLRRKIDYSQGSLMLDQEQMCENLSEDSESDSSSSSSSTCSSTNYSKSHQSSLNYEDDKENNFTAAYHSPQNSNGEYNMESDDGNEVEYSLSNGDPSVDFQPPTRTIQDSSLSSSFPNQQNSGSQLQPSPASSPIVRHTDINTVD